MSIIHKATNPEALRLACQIADATEITVYDADFPDEAKQQFVQAIVRTARGTEKTFDLTDMDWRDLNYVIEQEAEATGETVKFVLDLGVPEVITLELWIENHYEDDDMVETTVTALVTPPPDEDDKDATDEWRQAWIFPHTGTGQESGNSAYFVKVDTSSRPEVIAVGTEYEFGL